MIEPGRTSNAFVRRGGAAAAFAAARTAAHHGRQSIVLLEGPAGFGKTTVLTSELRQWPATRILQATAEPDETTTSYGILGQLLRGWDGVLPEPLVAAARGRRMTADPLEAGVLLLTLLDEVPQRASGHGVILAVDNVQWADTASLRALVFAFRRLRGAPIILVLTCRDDDWDGLPPSLIRLVDEEATRIRLGPFDQAETLELAGLLGLDRFDAHAARQVVAHTRGHPLYVRAVLGELAATGLRPAAAAPLPIPASYAQLVERRLAACSADAAGLVRAASLMVSPRPLSLLAGVAGLDTTRALAALDTAVAAGLLEQSTEPTGPACVMHPLTRAAVYRTLPPARRADLHGRAAQALDDIDPASALRHRVSASVGPDPALAVTAYERALARFRDDDWVGAVEWFRLALRTADPAEPAYRRYLLGLTESAVLAVDTSVAAELRDMVRREAPSPLRDYVRARVATLDSDLQSAHDHAVKAWQLTETQRAATGSGAEAADPEHTDSDLRVRIAAEIARTSLTLGLIDDTVHWAGIALSLARDGASAAADMPGTLLLAQALRGDFAQALAAFTDMPSSIAEPTSRDIDALVARGLLSMWAGDLQQARSDLGAAAGFTRRHGPLHLYVGASAYLSETAYRLGEWDLAITQAESALQLAQDLDHDRILPLLHAAAAAPHAARGHSVIAAEHVRAATRIAERIGDFQALLWARTAAGRVARSRDDVPGVIAALEPLILRLYSGLANEPGLAPWHHLYAEALIRQGSPDAAERILTGVSETAQTRGLAVSLLWTAATRALLHVSRGDHAAALAALQHTEDLAAHCDQPFELACVNSLTGDVWLTLGEPDRAAACLRRAVTAFRALGATPWVNRAAALLRRAQLATATHRSSPSELTGQEQRICALLAAGRTNREMASALTVSVKTIEFHVSNILTKLAFRSRTEIATWYAAQSFSNDAPSPL